VAAAEAPTVVDRFREWAEKAGATVEIVPDEQAAPAAVQRLATDASRVVATNAARRFAPDGSLVGRPAAEVVDADLGISVAFLAIAETGSLLLGSNAIEDRMVAMLSRTHVIVVDGRNLVASLDDASRVLRRLSAPGPLQLRYLGFITGPSRTADIERVLTIGVQGPRALHIILFNPSADRNLPPPPAVDRNLPPPPAVDRNLPPPPAVDRNLPPPLAGEGRGGGL
jgi:L-lactate utilization protein LutC